MLKSESYGADFSFDRICLIPSILSPSEQYSGLAGVSPAIQRAALRCDPYSCASDTRQRKIQTNFIPEPSLLHPRSCVESYPELGTREEVFLRRRTAGLRHSN